MDNSKPSTKLKLFFNSLAFRAGVVIIFAEVAILFVTGFYYIQRFTEEVEKRVEANIKIPGILMNRGLLSYEAISDRGVMLDLVGGDLNEGMIVGINRRIYYSLDPGVIGKTIEESGVDIGGFDLGNPVTAGALVKGGTSTSPYLSCLTPITVSGSKSPFLFVYIKVSEKNIQLQKSVLTNLFILGSLICVIFTSLIIMLAFNMLIFRKINILKAISIRIRDGDLESPVERYLLSSYDEIGALSVSFESMRRVLLQSTMAMLEYSKHMEEEVVERTRLLNEKIKELESLQIQLVRSEKMAAIGQLSAGVAHEINNPMGVIVGNMEVLKVYFEKILKVIACLEEYTESVFSGQAQNIQALKAKVEAIKKENSFSYLLKDVPVLVKDTLEAASRIKNIVNNLRTFSHPGKTQLSVASVNDSIETALALLENEIKLKAVIEKKLQEVPKIECHPEQLSQVFANILLNALHAIKDNGKIIVSTYVKDRFIFTEISDNGTGISQENLHKIFDPFFTTKEIGHGTGLGLSIVYNIIKDHGGFIDVNSELGKGTTFVIRLPLRKNNG